MFLPGTRIEIVNPDLPRGQFSAALFDFDGTLSLVREGWPEVMIPMMVDILVETPRAETREALSEHVEEFVMKLNGKQTIFQMMQLAEEVEQRGGQPSDPLEYKQQYHDLLWERVSGRVAGLKDGSVEPEILTVPCSLELLENLQAAGCDLYLASGTDLQYVEDELAALKLDAFFTPHVYGALDEYQNFSKKMIIERLVKENNLGQGGLLGFGDGYVEIEEIKRVGGIAVGVASDEKERTGINDWKRDRLIRAGADIIIPDYREREALLKYLTGE